MLLLLLLAAVVAEGENKAGECSRRIRGEGEEDTLVILKPDAVRPFIHELVESS